MKRLLVLVLLAMSVSACTYRTYSVRDGEWEDLPDGSFQSSGTRVRAGVAVIHHGR